MSNLIPSEPVEILLIEDNPGDVRLTKEAFNSIETETTFHVVKDGEEAADYFHLREDEPGLSDDNPDLVLLDLNLPRIDGFRVLELLDTKLDYPPPPILVLSSSSAESDISESYKNAANAYLTKPDNLVEYNEMAGAIEEFWLETAHHPPAPS
ncbi:response regulator [Natronolimnobius baerhuensis]|uniref:Response regulator n=1 Tax=Natronolimnobius baerhuensis TaxID=253108 RepID=A0A202E5A9_9EURY|nr:response regulator [Natronolimnobius baerhuensis]OVE83483.1 response regulator [Natronolimnobius baerhuensis]